MPPAEGRRRMDAAERRSLRQALAFDHRSGVIEPAFLLAQMRHGRLGQRVERAPAALAAKPQKAVRAAPADDFSARAMWAALGLDALVTGCSKRVLSAPAPRRLARPASGETSEPERPSPPSALLSASNASPRCAPLKPAIAESHAENSSAFIESVLNPDPTLNQINS